MKYGGVSLALLCLSSSPAWCEDDAWRVTNTFEAWFYGTHSSVRENSVVNPNNNIANLASNAALFDGRFNVRAENGSLLFVANPRLVDEQNASTQGLTSDHMTHLGSGKLDQSFMRYQEGDTAFTVGRELFVWGPANFRSPSSPFYFDAGRTNPLADTPGVDLVRVTQGIGTFRVTGAYVFSTSQVLPTEDLSHTAVLKIDQQGASHLASLIVSQQQSGIAQTSPFVGGFAQFTLGDAWLVYGEFGSSRQPYALSPNPLDIHGPFYSLQQPAPRSINSLVGANYTLENGQALVAEYLHNTGGYNASQTNAYFQQASNAGLLAQSQPVIGGAALTQALGQAPRLLGSDYLWLNWQSNPQEPSLLWRAGWTQNLTDRSGQALLYVEKNFIPKLSGFVALNINHGNVQTEYGALWGNSLTLGVKWFVF